MPEKPAPLCIGCPDYRGDRETRHHCIAADGPSKYELVNGRAITGPEIPVWCPRGYRKKEDTTMSVNYETIEAEDRIRNMDWADITPAEMFELAGWLDDPFGLWHEFLIISFLECCKEELAKKENESGECTMNSLIHRGQPVLEYMEKV